MSGLGFLHAPCLTFTSRMCCAAKPSMKVGSDRFTTTLKCSKRRTVKAEVCEKRGGKQVCPGLTIQEIPYVDEVVRRLAQNVDAFRKTQSQHEYLEQAYEKCKIFCAERDNFFFSGYKWLTEDQQRAAWALHAFFRRIDDAVDAPNIDDEARLAHLNQWEERTKDILNGRPHDMLDSAATDTLSKFGIENALIEDGMKGMRMDITKNRYTNFEELFLYCYYVSGTIALITFQTIGIPPQSTLSSRTIYDGAVYYGLAFQLTNILKDVSDDAQLGRVYLPQDELAQFGLCDDDIFSGKVTDGWKEFMKMQIQRTRFYYSLAEQGSSQLNKPSRSTVLSSMIVYSRVLDEIEEREYDNLTKKVEI